MANEESLLKDEPLTKPFWYSKEFWIAIIGGIVAPILATYGFNISNEQAVMYAETIVVILMMLTRLVSTKTKLTIK